MFLKGNYFSGSLPVFFQMQSSFRAQEVMLLWFNRGGSRVSRIQSPHISLQGSGNSLKYTVQNSKCWNWYLGITDGEGTCCQCPSHVQDKYTAISPALILIFVLRLYSLLLKCYFWLCSWLLFHGTIVYRRSDRPLVCKIPLSHISCPWII